MSPILCHPWSSRRRRARMGVSLLEVLISIFVLLIGLLGVAALIPAGRHHIAEANKADRGTACAQAILHDVRVRRLFDPNQWRYRNGNAVVVTGGGQNLLQCRTYAIDPLFIATNLSDSNADAFPYNSTSGMARVTLAGVYDSNSAPGLVKAQQLCTWRDDLLFPVPDDPSDRPRSMILADVGAETTARIPWPVRASDNVSGTPRALSEENQGDFTWLLTVTPIGPIVPVGGVNYVDIDQPLSYEVSVVVFHKRDLLAPVAGQTAVERMATSLSGGGVGGGDVQLGDADVQQNDWVMVGDANHPYAWYRVVAAEEAGPSSRYVTLAGPDWPTTYSPTAAVFSGVVGVFTTIVPAEGKD